MLCTGLSGFELYSRWVSLSEVYRSPINDNVLVRMFIKLSIISSFLEIILVNDVQIFAFPLYPYYIKE